MNAEGGLRIELTSADSAVMQVNIESHRPVHASRVMIGRHTADSRRMIPLLFNLCATAQSCAGVRACEQALDKPASAAVQKMRDQLVNAETLREHLWRIYLDWPAFIDAEAEPERADMAEMLQIQRDYQQAFSPHDTLFQAGATTCQSDLAALKEASDRLSGLLQRTLFAMPPEEWLALAGEQQLFAWAAARQTTPAKLINRVLQSDWSASGACESEALPQLNVKHLHAAMRDADYIRQPRWRGHCCETSSLTRTDSPLLDVLKQEYANGLLTRLVAKLTEIARLAGQLMPKLQRPYDECCSAAMAANPGIGQAAAARGQLVHRVGLDGDFISGYQILSPTEWNFHPRGVVAQALLTLKGTPAEVEQQARLLINAIDPCVAYELMMVQGSSG